MDRPLNEQQQQIIDTILDAANGTSQSKYFFIDGPSGSGKTFILTTLYNRLNAIGLQVQCISFTGLASKLLPYGKTYHSAFGLGIPLEEDSPSSIAPESDAANHLAQLDVFLMDEAPMLPKYGFNSIDQLLRKIANNDLPFGGKVIVLGGDFRQCLPIKENSLSIKSSDLWPSFTKLFLIENMLVDPEQQSFAEFLLQLGNGELPTDSNNSEEIELPLDILSNGDLIGEVFGNCIITGNFEEMKDRAIIAPHNETVNKINDDIVNSLPEELYIYLPVQPAVPHQPELHSFNDVTSLPLYELKLKKNCIIIMLCNVNELLFTGTRLIVTDLCDDTIKARIIIGEQSGREVDIPRKDYTTELVGSNTDTNQFPVKQFPVKLAFALTVHKAQGQTFEFVGVDLTRPVFKHGMLYAAFSRVNKQSALKVLLPKENPRKTRNIVCRQLLDD